MNSTPHIRHKPSPVMEQIYDWITQQDFYKGFIDGFAAIIRLKYVNDAMNYGVMYLKKTSISYSCVPVTTHSPTSNMLHVGEMFTYSLTAEVVFSFTSEIPVIHEVINPITGEYSNVESLMKPDDEVSNFVMSDQVSLGELHELLTKQ